MCPIVCLDQNKTHKHKNEPNKKWNKDLHQPEDVDERSDDAVGECGAERDESKRRRRPGPGEQAGEVGRPAGEERGDHDGGRFDGAALLAREH